MILTPLVSVASATTQTGDIGQIASTDFPSFPILLIAFILILAVSLKRHSRRMTEADYKDFQNEWLRRSLRRRN